MLKHQVIIRQQVNVHAGVGSEFSGFWFLDCFHEFV